VRTYPNFLRTIPQQTVYRFKKYRTIYTELVLKTQFGVNRSVQKIHFFIFLTPKIYKIWIISHSQLYRVKDSIFILKGSD
jgi:hypothetical protein